MILSVLPQAHALDVLSPVCQQYIDNNGNVIDPQKPVPTVCIDAANAKKGDPLVGPNGVLTKAVNILSLVVGIIAVWVIILFGGLRMIISGGNPQTVATARKTVIFAAVGLGVAVVAKLVVAFVISKAGQ
ncbi:MAG TPA: hypothetical protein VLF87_02445 [Patescibacteria group bacterium]|nr:hypothetical protein [Candidatus Saccharimonadales bacterium]HSX46822.1 hypothetical protein [Patescibacteria group bacterium]